MEVEPAKKVQNALRTARIIMVFFLKFYKRKRPASIDVCMREKFL